MPDKSSPSVYLAEVFSGSTPIELAKTSTAGMIGMIARYPGEWGSSLRVRLKSAHLASTQLNSTQLKS